MKSRVEEDDDKFMASLRDALCMFKIRKAEAATRANTAFSFDNDTGPSSKESQKVR